MSPHHIATEKITALEQAARDVIESGDTLDKWADVPTYDISRRWKLNRRKLAALLEKN